MKESLMMLSNFIKNPKEIGAIAKSSVSLTRRMMEGIDFETSKIFVELGPGPGTFTQEILKRARPDARPLCLEVNSNFCSYLKKNINDERLVVLNRCATKIDSLLSEFLNSSHADCIISGLPFRLLSENKKRTILNGAAKSIGSRGKFILFQYTNNLKPMLDAHFRKIERSFVPMNIPPAFVYTCGN